MKYSDVIKPLFASLAIAGLALACSLPQVLHGINALAAIVICIATSAVFAFCFIKAFCAERRSLLSGMYELEERQLAFIQQQSTVFLKTQEKCVSAAATMRNELVGLLNGIREQVNETLGNTLVECLQIHRTLELYMQQMEELQKGAVAAEAAANDEQARLLTRMKEQSAEILKALSGVSLRIEGHTAFQKQELQAIRNDVAAEWELFRKDQAQKAKQFFERLNAVIQDSGDQLETLSIDIHEQVKTLKQGALDLHDVVEEEQQKGRKALQDAAAEISDFYHDAYDQFETWCKQVREAMETMKDENLAFRQALEDVKNGYEEMSKEDFSILQKLLEEK